MDSEISNVLKTCWDHDTEQRPLFIDILRFFNTYTKQLLPDVDIKETDDQVDLYQVGRLYDMGYGTVADPERAFEYYSRAEKGHAISMYYMSRFLKEGRGTDVDIERS